VTQNRIEAQVDKIRYAMEPAIEMNLVRELLNMFEEDSGNLKG